MDKLNTQESTDFFTNASCFRLPERFEEWSSFFICYKMFGLEDVELSKSLYCKKLPSVWLHLNMVLLSPDLEIGYRTFDIPWLLLQDTEAIEKF